MNSASVPLDCPKNMTYGPCGGARGDACEVPGHVCGFVGMPVRRWRAGDAPRPGPDRLRDLRGETGPRSAAARRLLARIRSGGVITCDLPAGSDATTAELAPILHERVDAVVVGEPAGAHGGLAPAHRAAVMRAEGFEVITALTCRDRNRVALEGEIAALADVGVAGVLALTGDHPATSPRAEVPGVFDLDSTRLSALTHRGGHLTVVVENPTASPRELRPARLAQKLAAGADVCIVGACAPDILATFARGLAEIGVAMPLIAVVPIAADTPEAADALDAASPAIERAVAHARFAASVPGVVGVHISARAESAHAAAVLTARVADRLREVPA